MQIPLQGRYSKMDFLDGYHSKGRFGLSVANAGDINLDGYGDFAVGAPYGGDHGNGAVYIFHGSAAGVKEKYTQVIYAEEVSMGRRPIQTFGFSVAGGLDLDQNQYPDLVVGAYLSNEAYFFRARPVVKVEGHIKFHTHRKLISLEENNCTLPDGQAGTCTSFELCVKIHGVGVPGYVDLDLNYTLDSQRLNQQRLFFYGERMSSYYKKESMRLHRDNPHFQCATKQVYIKNNIRDKLTPLEVSVDYEMRSERGSFHTEQRNPRSALLPTLDLTSASLKKDHINIKKNCGPDDKCVPDLGMVVRSSVNRYLLGSGELLEVEVTVTNIGEDSYESTFEMSTPSDVHYVNVQSLSELRVTCDEFNNTIRCDIGNPLPQNKISKFVINLAPQKLKDGELFADSYNFTMKVNSSNPEEGMYIKSREKETPKSETL